MDSTAEVMVHAPESGAGEAQHLRECGTTVRSIADLLEGLAPTIEKLELAPLASREWYRLLREKLLPQLGEEAYLVVAVVGGTNIGKSVIFNHIADARLSARKGDLRANWGHRAGSVPARHQTISS